MGIYKFSANFWMDLMVYMVRIWRDWKWQKEVHLEVYKFGKTIKKISTLYANSY